MAENTIIQCNLTELEAEVIALFRRQTSRLKYLPDGWTFAIDANPDRLVGTFSDKERVEMKRVKQSANGHVR